MDSGSAVRYGIYNRLVGDPALQVLCGGAVRLRYMNAWPNDAFPYLVYRLTTAVQDPAVLAAGTLLIDVWSDTADADNAQAIVGRVIELLDLETALPCPSAIAPTSDAIAVRLFLPRCQDIPTDEMSVWRVEISFGVRYCRQAEIVNIVP